MEGRKRALATKALMPYPAVIEALSVQNPALTNVAAHASVIRESI